MIKTHVTALSLALLLAGCGLRPELPNQQQSFTPSTSLNTQISLQWWKEFNDPVLDELIAKALDNNLNLKIAYINMQKAARALGISKAEWLPSLSLSAGATRSGSTGQPNNAFNVRAGLSYELDIWGKVRDSVDTASAELVATGFDYDAARLSLAASVAKGYFSLASLLAQKDVYEKSLKSYEATMTQYADKLALGAIGENEYLQSVSSVQNARVNLANLNSSISSAEAALAILTGASNDEIIYGATKIGDSKVPFPAQGISAELLANRPDVAAAWQRVIAANAKIGVAKKAWLPSISLSAGFGYASSELDRLIMPENSSWSIGGNLAQMIFDAGRINANIDIAKLNEDAAFISYESAVRNAISEAVTALDAASSADAVQKRSAELLKTQEKIYDITKIQYDNGATEYISLLDAERTLLNARLALAKAEFSQKSAVVDVFKALGGGWSEQSVSIED